LLGAADGAVESAGVTFGPAEQRLRRWVLMRLDERIDRGALEQALQTGRALPIGDAVRLAQQYLD
jgi:hypothetical protein